MTVLVVGVGKTGEAVARWAARTGTDAVFTDDAPEGPTQLLDGAFRVVRAPSATQLEQLVSGATMVVPNPAVSERHRVFELANAAAVPVVSEIELAWSELHGTGRRVVAVTGTNGKTTVTTLIERMLTASGVAAVAAGNIGYALLDATVDPVDVVVAEVSSFQLRFIDRFRPAVAVWLNVAEDHADWHVSSEAYVAAKARVIENQQAGDVFVFNADDAVVAAHARAATGESVPFTLYGSAGAYTVRNGELIDRAGGVIVAVAGLPRALPADLANALAATAAADAAGAQRPATATTLTDFEGLPHRVALVRQSGGVRFYDDSKATNPHATLGAVGAFDSVVLIAGGRNKGNDLGVLRELAPRIRSVVAIGEAAGEIETAFAGVRPVTRAPSMRVAVRAAAAAARPGDAVLLSPACASWDQYRNYAERGDDFSAEVRALPDFGTSAPPTMEGDG